MSAANTALAIWRGDEHVLSFLFAAQLSFRLMKKDGQQNKQ
jgi:hypothetical protein